MTFSRAFSFLFILQLGHYCSARSETACSTRRQCDKQRRKLDFNNFFIGNYPTKGCFSKSGIAYYGRGGNSDDKAEHPLTGEKERIWCNESASKPKTNIPTSAPTKPLQTASLGEGDISGEECIDVQVKLNTGKLYGGKAGFRLSSKATDGSPSENLLDFPVGSLEEETQYAPGPDCVPKGTYTLTVAGKSSYSALVGGEEVLFGSNSWEETNSLDIVVGYEPAMNDVEKAWLDGHNTRREDFHKKHNEKYRPLKWSPRLATDASKWVDKMLPSCEFAREPNLKHGENIATNNYSGSKGPSDDEIPDKILARWADKKLDEEYPNNQTLTQVMWRGTRYLGCASKSALNDDGNYCYVSICRYSRPGNCNMRSGNWLDVTLGDTSPCGEACPKEGCH